MPADQTPDAQAQLAALRVRRREVEIEIQQDTFLLRATQERIKRLQTKSLTDPDPVARMLAQAELPLEQQAEKRTIAKLAALNEQLRVIDEEISRITAPRPGLTAQESAGNLAKDDAAAAAEGSRTQNPVPPEQTLSPGEEIVDISTLNRPPSNASQPPLANNAALGLVDGVSTAGGSSPTRTSAQTQPGARVAPGDDARQTTGSGPGQSTNQPSAEGRAPVAQEFVDPIPTTPNLLAKLASMTYTASIYLLNPTEYSQLLANQRKSLPPTSSLIIQSAGIPQGLRPQAGVADVGEVPGVTTFSQARNPYFDVDFYLDNITLESLVTGKAGVGAHSAFSLDFTVIEPYGITLLPRLKAAVTNHLGASEDVNELSQNFLMVIRFYGYDDRGIMINGANLGVTEARSDLNAIVEKWIPFQLNSVTYRIQNKVTEYAVKATVVDSSVAFNTIYASIPFNFELTADTVQDLLNGKATLTQRGQDLEPDLRADQTTAAPPPKAAAIPSKSTYIGGLCDALNQHDENIRKKRGYEIANRYVIELEDVPGLKDAKVARPGRPDKSSSAMNANQEAAQKYLGSKTSYQADMKNFSVVAGTQIVQLIDMVMRTSSYITSQQNIIYDPKTGIPTNQTPVTTVQWFRIRSECRPIGYDRKRNAIAYEIKYIVSRYQINDPRSAYFPQARYRGAHKKYNYWFTGENSEMLDFQIDVNTMFFVSIGNDGKTPPPQPNAQFQVRNVFNTQTGQSQQPGPNQAGLPAANLADRLYAPTDVAQIKVEILGDPDWIQQSEVFYKGIDLSPFAKDGSVNFDASEVLFEVNFNPATDYDLSVGLMDTTNRTKRNQTLFRPAPQKSVFSAFQVTSKFRQGRFTQDLQGTVIDFDTPVALGNAAPATSAAASASPPASAGGSSPPGTRTTSAPVPEFQLEVSPGLLDLELGNNNGPINYKPRGLAQVLDDQAPGGASAPSPKPGTGVVSDDAIPNARERR